MLERYREMWQIWVVWAIALAPGALAKGGQWQGALSLLDSMTRAEVAPNDFTCRLKQVGRPERPWEAMCWWRGAMGKHMRINQKAMNCSTWCGINIQLAAHLLWKTRTLGSWPNDFEAQDGSTLPAQCSRYSSAISACSEPGEWQIALELLTVTRLQWMALQ